MKPLSIDHLRDAVAQGRIQWRKHVLQKLAERGISQDAVREVLLSGERVRDYAEDRPFPSALFLGYIGGKPLHVPGRAGSNEQRSFYYHCLRAIVGYFRIRLSNQKKIMSEICPICGGKKTKGKTTFSVDLGSVVVVRDVDATICSQCGEEWIDDATACQLEQIVNDARARRLQVEVAALK